MENAALCLKQLILTKYKSILSFAQAINMPYSTIDSVFKRGVNFVNASTITKICIFLGISTDSLVQGDIVYVTDLSTSIINPSSLETIPLPIIAKYWQLNVRDRAKLDAYADLLLTSSSNKIKN